MKIDLEQARLASDLLDQINESMNEALRARISLMQRDLRHVLDEGYTLTDCTICERGDGAYLGIKHGERWLIGDGITPREEMPE